MKGAVMKPKRFSCSHAKVVESAEAEMPQIKGVCKQDCLSDFDESDFR